MPDLLPFDHRKDPTIGEKAEYTGGFRRSLEAAGITTPEREPGPKTSAPTNAYLVTVEILETKHVTYLVPAFSPEEAERLVARKPNQFEITDSVPVGIEGASVVNVEPVTTSRG